VRDFFDFGIPISGQAVGRSVAKSRVRLEHFERFIEQSTAHEQRQAC
jgi:hypothetical protein